MHRDEVRAGQHSVEWEQFDSHLRGAGRRHIGVIGDDMGTERGQSRSHKLTDAAQAHHADGLTEQLHPVELRTLPGVVAQGGIGGGDLARSREHQRQRVLGGAVDVGGGGIDHQYTGGGSRLHIDVVESDAGAGDDLELRGRGDHLGVDGGGRTHQQRIGVGNGFQQLRAVRAVDPADLDLIAQCGDGRFGKFVGDQNNRQSHPDRLMGTRRSDDSA